MLYEREYFHWVVNSALRRLVEEGRIHTETRQLSTGSVFKLLWHRSYRSYKRDADEVFTLVGWYTMAATDGALGMQGEHVVIAAFARQKFLLIAEEANSYGEKTWENTNHNLDFIFERGHRDSGGATSSGRPMVSRCGRAFVRSETSVAKARR